MKMILTHKRQLKQRADVTRFLSYCFGKSLSRPVVPVEGYFPGLPTGVASIDASSLLSTHHGGKASKARSVAFSSEYFSSREEAETHAPAFPRVMSSFREQWASNSQAISIVHMSEGTGNWAGHWRLDGHLIVSNSTGKVGIQWTRKQCQEMQDFRWLSDSVSQDFGIQSGKGKGETKRTGTLPYPKTKLVAYEIGCLTDYELETHIKSGTYAAPRRAKDGRVISIEAHGKRINIQRARELVTIRDTGPGGVGILPEAQPHARTRNGRMVGRGLAPKRHHPFPARRTSFKLGRSKAVGRVGGFGVREIDALLQRRRGLSAYNPSGIDGAASVACRRILVGFGDTFPMAPRHQARASLSRPGASSEVLSQAIGEIETINIFT